MINIRKLVLLLSVLFFSTGCSGPLAKNYGLLHVPSEQFYKDRNLSDPFLAPFKANDNILFVLEPKEIGYPAYLFWLGVYSDIARQSIKINRVEIQSDLVNLDSSFTPVTLKVEETTKNNTYRTSLKLFDFSSDEAEKLNNSSFIKVIIYYEDPETGDLKNIEFDIDYYEYRDIAWPT